jgi:hypothetical protein
MRRTLLLVVGLLTLALAVPSVSSAHGDGHHGKGKKHKKAKRANLSGKTAGTIESFDGTTLTIRLASGATVAGEVDDDTDVYKIKVPATAGASNYGRHHDDDDDDRGGHHGWWKGYKWGWFWHGDEDDLLPGTTVYKASLEIDDDGAEWEKVKLLVPKSTTPPSDT